MRDSCAGEEAGDLQMMAKIEHIKVSAKKSGASIAITGDVKAEDLEGIM